MPWSGKIEKIKDSAFVLAWNVKGELQRKNKLILYERAFKMLENDMHIAGIGQAVLELLSFKVRPGNHQNRNLVASEIFGNLR